LSAKPASSFGPWFNLAMLAAESQQVIALRMMKLAAGGAAARDEARRMTSEKVAAMTEAGAKLMAGGSADSVVSGYRRKVRANIKRLTK
jgi:hypothetical protein